MADTAEIIPVIDLGPYLAGAPGAIDRAAGELRFALTEIGFYFIANHGVPSGQIREVFRQVRSPACRCGIIRRRAVGASPRT